MRVILVGILMVTLVLVPTLAMSASGSRDMDNSGSTMPNNSGTYSAPKDSGDRAIWAVPEARVWVLT